MDLFYYRGINKCSLCQKGNWLFRYLFFQPDEFSKVLTNLRAEANVYYFIMAADPEILPSETFNQTVIRYSRYFFDFS